MRVAIPSQFESGYFFEPEEVRGVVSKAYAEFLKRAGYVDFDKTPNLFVASGLLKVDERVEMEAGRLGVLLCDTAGVVTGINQNDARRFVRAFGGRILTSAFMFKLVYPMLREGSKGNAQMRETIAEMGRFAEHLEDRVLNRNELVVGGVKEVLELPREDGCFDVADLNEFGYPKITKQNGEFYYCCPRDNEVVAFRYKYDSEPSLNLDRGPGYVADRLGVRFAKFF